jgi:lysophospholipase L1-like esterase
MSQEPREFSTSRSIVFSTILFLLFFGSVEVALRLVGVGPAPNTRLVLEKMDTDITLPFMRADPDTFWSPTPGYRGVFMGKPVTINALGVRGGEVARPKPAGTKRLLCLGDSITFGYGVGDSETYPAALARDLPGWEVVNGGVTGFTSHQVLAQLRRLDGVIEPDVVTILIGWNDGNRRPVDDREYERRIRRIQLMEGTLDHLYLYRAIKGAYLRATVMKGLEWTRHATGHRATLDQYQENLRAMIAECARKGVRPVFIDLPHRKMPGEQPFSSDYEKALKEVAGAEGIPLLDCGVLGLETQEASNARFFIDSLHLTPEGNALFARHLADQLEALGIGGASARS